MPERSNSHAIPSPNADFSRCKETFMKACFPLLAVLVSAIVFVSGCGNPSSTTSTASTDTTVPATGGAPTQPDDLISPEPSTPNAATAATDPPARDSAATPKHELVDGITNAQLVSAFQSLHKAAADQPDSVLVQLQYMNVLQSIGHERARLGQMDQAYRTFAKAGEVARATISSKAELPESANNLLSVVFYNDACAASVGNDAKAAMASLEEAIKHGFSDFELLDRDDDLKLVRALPDYSDKIKNWKKAVEEIARQKVQAELANFKSFSFDFSLTDVTGAPLKLADHKGKVLIVDIWGTWCPPCRAEIPSFVKLQELYGDKGFQMIGLNQENQSSPEGDKLVQTFIKENNMNYPCALIDESTQSQVPDFEGYPTTLFLDRTGKVRLKLVGLHPYTHLESIVQTLLAEDAPGSEPAESTSAPSAE
jgi:thiol-disulfide isomerase/thioredoxin